MENKNIIIVTSKTRERFGNYLFQLISDYDGVDAALWNENEYRDNRLQLSSSQYVVFVGLSKEQKSLLGIKYIYDDGIKKIGWKGTRAVIICQPSTASDGFKVAKKTAMAYALGGPIFAAVKGKKESDNIADEYYIEAIDLFVEEYMPEFLKFEPEPEKDATEQSSSSAADEIFKFKQLLDAGIITEEEFEAKKKQLLNL